MQVADVTMIKKYVSLNSYYQFSYLVGRVSNGLAANVADCHHNTRFEAKSCANVGMDISILQTLHFIHAQIVFLLNLFQCLFADPKFQRGELLNTSQQLQTRALRTFAFIVTIKLILC